MNVGLSFYARELSAQFRYFVHWMWFERSENIRVKKLLRQNLHSSAPASPWPWQISRQFCQTPVVLNAGAEAVYFNLR